MRPRKDKTFHPPEKKKKKKSPGEVFVRRWLVIYLGFMGTLQGCMLQGSLTTCKGEGRGANACFPTCYPAYLPTYVLT